MSDLPAADTAEIETAGLDAPRPQRPENVPEKFWDSDAGGLRADALLKSYLELERKLGTGSREPEPVAAPTAAAAPSEAGEESAAKTPEIAPPPSSFTIASPHPLIEPDPQLNERLLGAGFSQSQAQLVYDLAAERLLPVIREALGEIEAQHQLERLQPVAQPDAMRRAAEGGVLLLERCDLAAEHEPPRLHDAPVGRIEFGLELGIDRFHVEKGNHGRVATSRLKVS